MKLIQQIESALGRHPVRVIRPADRIHAAVAIILREKPDGVDLLFIERSTNEKDQWSGQIGFPGGKVEPGDDCPRAAAEREALEELGIELARSRYLGQVSDVIPAGLGIVVSGFVYAVEQTPNLKPDHHEVAEAFWLPLQEMKNPLHRSFVEFKSRERVRRYPALELFEETAKPIWGITYRMLRNFNKALTPAGD